MTRESGVPQGLRENAGLWRILAALAETAGLLWEQGWAEANAGNLSCDVTEILPEPLAGGAGAAPTPCGAPFPELAGRRILVTAAGTRMRDLAREPDRGCGVLQCSGDGSSFVGTALADATPFTPTSELPSHLAIHAALRRRGSPERAVVHTHPTELLALSHDPDLAGEGRLDAALRAMHPELVLLLPDGLAVVPYTLPGTMAQGLAAGAAMERHDVALWVQHGAVATGAGFVEAFDRIDVVNKAARMLLLCRGAGFEPAGLSPAALAELRRASGRPPRG